MSSDTIIIDKFGFIEVLERKGFTRTQAEGLADAVSEFALSQLITKSDLKDFELRLYRHLSGILIAHALGTAAITVALVELLK